MEIPAPEAAFVQTLLNTSTPCPQTSLLKRTHSHFTYETRVQEQHHCKKKLDLLDAIALCWIQVFLTSLLIENHMRWNIAKLLL